MISQNQIVRLLEAREYTQAVDRILANGRCRSALTRRLLGNPAVAATAAFGLGLQRLSEITYRPSPLADALGHHLALLQRSDGFFDAGERPSSESLLAATAVSLRGLMTCVIQRETAGMAVDASLIAAIQRGLDAITQHFDEHQDIKTDAVGWAIVLWQLGDVNEFRNQFCVSSLLAMLDDTTTDLLQDELCRYAHAMAA